MKKVLFIMALSMYTVITCLATVPGGKLPFNIIDLRLYYDNGNNSVIIRPRTPMRIPEVYLSESTIIFENEVFCDRIVLVNTDNNIV